MPRIISKNWIYLLVTFLVAFSVSLVAAKFVISAMQEKNNGAITETGAETIIEVTPQEPAKPEFINLQPTVDEWLAGVDGNVGLMVYDLDHNQVAAEYNANEIFNSASIYKLFFVYDGWRQIEAGNDDEAEVFVTTSDKGALTLESCLDLMIRESYNGCADPMRADTERFARAEALATELGLQNTSSAGLYSSAADLVELLKFYWQHSDLSSETWAKIQDAMLNQPPTTYNWRQGLPSGFSDAALVYDKVGWNYNGSRWTIYDDAAIVEFPEQNRHYIIVVMTENFRTPEPLVRLGQMLESTIISDNVL